ncbi:hypothetical protein TNCT_64831 [Trichonephila clavata]|uniref:Uncharacterized protein n=1 Tax=Trichonephila clavata TaxID=2740835 RepID=A0A8X6IY64_TRICU|nr:hypothetical protein TNCT_64831 [Trichonephila clavata]
MRRNDVKSHLLGTRAHLFRLLLATSKEFKMLQRNQAADKSSMEMRRMNHSNCFDALGANFRCGFVVASTVSE